MLTFARIKKHLSDNFSVHAMHKIRTLKEKKIAKSYFFAGIVLYLLSTIGLIIAKLVVGAAMSGWWILAPALFVVGWVLVLTLLEYLKKS
ncbi:hypothetical protein [Arundinibacter roseus]|uniref:Uncharacterized protein n=1 Tax=Arundinibacter roseus TaxID=2070510 RepID=A0A4R4KJ34_9BACT|nr:hypothetical protein [Arundinibacter roseus]TDB66862.1 hypothetical protein EZE20_06980 [Arundinibacter roseus]